MFGILNHNLNNRKGIYISTFFVKFKKEVMPVHVKTNHTYKIRLYNWS